MKIPPHVQKGLAMAAGVLAIDQITKLWIVFTVMQPPRIIEVTPFFNLVMGWNWGVSFGLLDSASEISQWLLPLVTVTVLVRTGDYLEPSDKAGLAGLV
ncbi:MAG: hypothetical protein CFH02_00956, partial [Alphaproteobacteria bacterium MarineAlpha3_Bin1]